MNRRILRQPLVALGVAAATVLAALLATEARATPNRNPAPTARSAPQLTRLLPADAGIAVAFAFDPRDPNTVYVGTDHHYSNCRLYKSTDGGKHWQLISGRRDWKWLGALASDPKHPGTLYASTSTGIYKTTDGGRTWQLFTQGLVPPSGEAVGEGWGDLAVDPNNSNILYSSLGLSVHKSVDAGRTWQAVSGRGRLHTLVASTRPTTVYAGFFTQRAPFYIPVLHLESSTDGAKSWQQTSFHVALKRNDQFGTYDLAADPETPTTLYAAIQARIFVSTNAGQSWHFIGQALPQGSGWTNSDVTSLAAGPGTLYAVFGKKGIYQTSDEGQTWTHSWPQSGTAPGLGVSIVAIDPARPTTIYASAYYPSGRATGTHILRSTDSGHTWTVVG
jgi:photosystem II stability/assembly factor-like uncharacterized protein